MIDTAMNIWENAWMQIGLILIVIVIIFIYFGRKKNKKIKKYEQKNNLLKNIGISIWTILIVMSITGVISFVSISCVLIWALSLSLIIHINPDYDIVYLTKIVNLIIKIFIFEVIFLTINFVLYQVFKIKKHEQKN